MALIETARGVANARAVARCDAVSRLAFGSVDFALDLGLDMALATSIDIGLDADGPDKAFLLARSTLVIASRASGKAPPPRRTTCSMRRGTTTAPCSPRPGR